MDLTSGDTGSSGGGPRALASGLSGGVAGLVLRLLRFPFGGELFAFFFSFSFLFLAALEQLELLLSLFLLLLLNFLDFLGLLREQDLGDKDLHSEYELLWPDAGELACLPRGVLVRVLPGAFEGTTTEVASSVAASAAGEGGPGG